ncbi:hypothetical protein GCM10023231_40060 [Olivibacter ginsenosidimutans]|uniref:Uncharacterized protein n=1 Tax=Olivibacter ginsenosidimutans TaxID=1176537 RepID=A0ABP9C950_9SPHI
MRTSLIEIRLLEDYLQQRLSPEDKLLLEARLLLEEGLQERLSLQQRCYQLIQVYSRESVREQLQRVEHALFTQPAHKRLVQKIKQYFL